MGRIFIMLKKDWRDLVIQPLMILILFLFILFISSKTASTKAIGIYGEFNHKVPYDVTNISSIDDGLSLLKKGTIVALYDAHNQKLYAPKGSSSATNEIYKNLTNPNLSTDSAKDINTKRLIPFIFTMTLILLGFSLTITLKDFSDDFSSIKTLLTTPLKYSEYIMSKLIICFLSFTVLSIAICIVLTLFLGTFFLTVALSYFIFASIALVFISSLYMIMSLSTNNENLANMLSFLSNTTLILLAIIDLKSDYTLPLSISNGFNAIQNGNFPMWNLVVILSASIVLLYIASSKFRKLVKS